MLFRRCMPWLNRFCVAVKLPSIWCQTAPGSETMLVIWF